MDTGTQKRIIVLPKKVSWVLLTAFFIFDCIVSYVAVTTMGGRELNSVIAPFVEKYPLLYFLCVPLELLGGYIIIKILRKWTDEKILLTATVIYWPIANSSMNLLFILGFRHMGFLWLPLTVIGIAIALSYVIFTLLRES